jgi:hypothetical protein
VSEILLYDRRTFGPFEHTTAGSVVKIGVQMPRTRGRWQSLEFLRDLLWQRIGEPVRDEDRPIAVEVRNVASVVPSSGFVR